MDTAQNVTYAVPGMGSSAEGMGDWAKSSENVLKAQMMSAPGQTHAVVAWIGYEAPPVGPFGVLGTDFAREGAPHLGTALRGFEATRPDAQLNVLAHSYGTTTASIALTEPGVHVDSFVSIGSAGLTPSIDEASDLHADEVFAGQARDVWAIDPAPGDKWAWFGRAFSDHPVNPVSDDFGAKTFGRRHRHGWHQRQRPRRFHPGRRGLPGSGYGIAAQHRTCDDRSGRPGHG